MATINYWQGSWQSAGQGNDLIPGDSHHWVAWGFFDFNSALDISAQPVQGGEEHILTVENVRTESASDGRRVFYDVRNAGSTDVPGYAINYVSISS